MRELSARYPVWFCDVWGVLHNGIKPYEQAVKALTRHRRNGGTVVLVTNAPRTRPEVEKQIAALGVDPQSHDAIVTSGDVTRVLMTEHGGGHVFHLGPARNLSIFEGLEIVRTSLSEAKAVVCTGLFDDRTEIPRDYEPLLRDMKSRDLVMICANPDRIVRIGDHLQYCAGSLAEAYLAMGGSVLMAGKPFRPIYELARREAESRRSQSLALDGILAIGDGPLTDIRGAADFGIDAVLIADGVTDPSAGLAVVEQEVKQIVPEAHIVKTMHHLAWD